MHDKNCPKLKMCKCKRCNEAFYCIKTDCEKKHWDKNCNLQHEPRVCANCNKTFKFMVAFEGDAKLKKCRRCGLVWYCGAECQRKHWEEHKSSCFREHPPPESGIKTRSRSLLPCREKHEPLKEGTPVLVEWEGDFHRAKIFEVSDMVPLLSVMTPGQPVQFIECHERSLHNYTVQWEEDNTVTYGVLPHQIQVEIGGLDELMTDLGHEIGELDELVTDFVEAMAETAKTLPKLAETLAEKAKTLAEEAETKEIAREAVAKAEEVVRKIAEAKEIAEEVVRKAEAKLVFLEEAKTKVVRQAEAKAEEAKAGGDKAEVEQAKEARALVKTAETSVKNAKTSVKNAKTLIKTAKTLVKTAKTSAGDILTKKYPPRRKTRLRSLLPCCQPPNHKPWHRSEQDSCVTKCREGVKRCGTRLLPGRCFKCL